MLTPTKNIILALVCAAFAMVACNRLDCPLNNVALSRYGFYTIDESGTVQPCVLKDTLTITAVGTDSVLLNRQTNVKTLDLPMSHWNTVDSLVFTWKRDDVVWHDTISVKKHNMPHYESPECPTVMFHYIASVVATHHAIDSVAVSFSLVNYEQNENIKIFFATAP